MSEPVTRRNWLARVLGASVTATFGVLFYPVVRFLWPKEATSSGALEVKRPTRWTSSPARAKRACALPPFDFGGKPCLLILVDGEPRALSAVCTHLQCTVEFRPVQQVDPATVTTAFTTSTAATSPARRRGPWKSTGRSKARATPDRRRSLSHEMPDTTTRPPGWDRGLKGFLYERLGLDAAFALAAKKRVPTHRSSVFYFLGGMALFLFGIQVITGILLALFYKPSPDQAFESVRGIVTEVPYGWLFRSIHSWSANLLIGVLLLHILTTYIMRAYRRPREVTWWSGLAPFGLFLTFGFSGYLLPWNKLAFFATKVGTSVAGGVPLIGKYLMLLARGGENVTGDTLGGFMPCTW